MMQWLHNQLSVWWPEPLRLLLFLAGILSFVGLNAAYLVERAQVAAFRGTVSALAAEHPTLQFLCTGPWPPYNFVTITLDAPSGASRSMEQP